MKEKHEIFNPALHIHDLFQRTENGMLPLEYDRGDSYCVKVCPMNWTEEDVEPLIQQLETLLCRLDHIAQHYNTLIEEPRQADVLLNPREKEIWQIMVKPFEGFDVSPEEMGAIFMNEELGELTEAEQKILDRYRDWFEGECEKRMPVKNGAHPKYLINHARRYTRLVSMKAPQVIINIEAESLANEMAVYYHTGSEEKGG